MMPYTFKILIAVFTMMANLSGLSNETEHLKHIFLAKLFSYPSYGINEFKSNYLRILSLYGNPEYRKYFVRSVNDDNPKIRLQSLIALLNNKDLDLKDILIQRLHQEPDKEIQVIIAKELSRNFADGKTLNEFEKVLNDPSITVFRYFLACVSAYNISGDSSYLEDISRIIKEGSIGEQQIYLSWIQEINDLSFIPVVEVCFPEKAFLHDEAGILINELKYNNNSGYQLTRSH